MLRRIALYCIIILGAPLLFAQQSAQNLQAQVVVDIQFHDQTNYYENDKVLVKITITNNSPSVYRFRLADKRMFSVDFSVQNLANMATPPSDGYRRILGSNESVFTRDIALRPGEEFSFIETINDYRQLPAGMYVVTSYFYPELRNNTMVQPLVSNRLNLNVRPEVRRQVAAEETLRQEVQQILRAQALPPDQVVMYMLEARMRNNREQYFLYLDVETLYARDAPRSNAYRRMSELERMTAIDNYRDTLWGLGTDGIIPKIPSNYEVMKTAYDSRTGKVEVLQFYRSGQIIEKWLVEYTLVKKDQIWYISDYTPTFKGTE